MRPFALFCIVVLFALILPASAQEDGSWIYTSSDLTISTILTESVEPVAETSSSKLEFVRVNLSFFPQQLRQQDILDAAYSPPPKQTGPTVVFEWDQPSFKPLLFKLSYKVRTTRFHPVVSEKIPFPIRNLPAGTIPYTYPEPIIDSDDPAVQQLAAQLAEGETDLMVVLNKLAVWTVEHVQYNLSTVTAKASKSASWVLQNRQGVCDELTSLFIAMSRSLGIPARFVSGISYTNSPLFTEKWGPHGWAEVYVPSVGWVPYDVTYEEFGFVDSTHIITKYSKDAAETSLEYDWRGKDVQLKAGELGISAEIIDYGSQLPPTMRITLAPWKQKTGFGSFNAVIATVENTQDYYQSAALTLSQTGRIHQLDSQKKFLLLKPKETKTVVWAIQVETNLDDQFVYTFPISVHSFGLNATTEFMVTERGPVYALDDVREVMQQENVLATKPAQFQIDVNCAMEKQAYSLGDVPKATCTLRNLGLKALQGDACILDDCKSFSLSGSGEQRVQYTLPAAAAGKQQYLLSITGAQFHKNIPFFFLVEDKAKVEVTDVSSPISVSYGEQYPLTFRLNRESETTPENVTLTISLDGLEQHYFVPFLDTAREFTITLDGADLDLGENDIAISAVYTDKLGTKGMAEEHASILLKKPTFFQRLAIYFKRLGKWITKAVRR